MWRLRFLPWRKIGLGAIVVAALAAAGVAFALIRGGDGKKAAPRANTNTGQANAVNLYYVRALAAKTQVNGCAMKIRFVWKPDYHANQYIGATAVITANGTGIAGSYRKPFTEKGVSIELPVSLAGGYQVWTAKVASIDGDPPGNDTTISAAPPQSSKCR